MATEINRFVEWDPVETDRATWGLMLEIHDYLSEPGAEKYFQEEPHRLLSMLRRVCGGLAVGSAALGAIYGPTELGDYRVHGFQSLPYK